MIVGLTVTDSREAEISDAIRSVVDHVDRVLIIDTGVADRTIDRARDVAGGKLVVAAKSWIDFARARNDGIDTAEALGAKWIVIVDSDERLNLGKVNLRKALAGAQADVLLVESDDGLYPKEKIIRAGSGARFFGPTHEALLGGSRSLLRGVTFSELPKTDDRLGRKLNRDLKVLSSFIASHPRDPRWRYYLGATLEGLGRYAEAAAAFGECARLRQTGWEAAWASFKEAEQLLFLDRCQEAIAAAARGLGADATFGECAWIAAESSARLGLNAQAVAWARTAEAVGRYKHVDTERLWFRHLPALYELPYDVLRRTLPTAAARDEAERLFREARMARIRAIEHVGEQDLEVLSVSRRTPASAIDEIRSLLRPLPIARVCPSARAVRIQFEPPGGRLPMNPSICFHRGELWCVVRAINYTMKGWDYTIHDPYGVVRTENYIGRLGLDGTFDPQPMLDLDLSPRYPSRIVGYEDVRLVSITDRGRRTLAASATVCDRDPEDRRLIARLYLDTRKNVKRAEVQPSNQVSEKNWMPLSVDGKLTWIYSLDPTAILPGPLRQCALRLDHLRGGAAIPFGKGYLCVMHEVIQAKEGRVYLHRFVRLDTEFNVVSVSPTWTFAHHGIEFCAGLARHKNEIIISYGIRDREAWIMRINVRDIEAMKWITP